jgi:biopolymer transport protein ExbB/TolQ
MEPLPTKLVATASGISVAVVGLGVLLYLKKRNHKTLTGVKMSKKITASAVII